MYWKIKRKTGHTDQNHRFFSLKVLKTNLKKKFKNYPADHLNLVF